MKRKLHILFVLCAFLGSTVAYGQSYLITGPNNGQGPLLSTENTTSNTGWTEIHSDNSGGGASDNSWSTAQTLPFPFELFGNPVTQFCVSKNYLLTFDASVAGTTLNASVTADNSSLPNADLPDNTIAYLWGGFDAPLGGNDDIFMKVFGTAPNRQLWIKNFSYKYESQSYTYNIVVLEESTNKIYVVDNRWATQGAGSYTVGVQLDGTTAFEHVNSPNISSINGNVVSWDPTFVEYYEFEPFNPVPDNAGTISVDSLEYFCAGNHDVYATIGNFGSNIINSVEVNWTVNGVPQPTVNYTGTLDVIGSGNPTSESILLGNVALLDGANDIQVTTSLPNGNPDSDNSNDVVLTTFNSTAAPSSFTVSNVTANTADLTVENGGLNFEYEYGPPGFTPGTGTLGSASTSPFTVPGLNSATDYDIYVRTDCGTSTSAFIGPESFTTLCSTFPVPHINDFSNFLPNCWEEGGSGTPATGPLTTGFGDWIADDWLNETANADAARINLYFNNDEEWLISPTFDLTTGGPYELVLEVAVTDFSTSNADVMGSDDEVQVLVSTDGGATWSNIHTWTVSNQPSELGQFDIFNLSAYAGTNAMFAVWATDGAVNDLEDYNFWVNSFEIRPVPSCPQPSDFIVSNNSNGTEIELSWTENGSATAWNIEYGPAGFTPGTGSTVTAGTNPFTVTGLTQTTDYEFYIQADCGGGDQSFWTGPTAASTPIESLSCTSGSAFTLLYEEFEGGFPSDWTNTNTSAPDWSWDSNTTTSSSTGPSMGFNNPGYVYLETTGGVQGDADTLNAPQVDLSAVVAEARMSFYYHMYGSSMGDLLVRISTDNGANWTQVWSISGEQQSDELDPWSAAVIDLTPFTGSTLDIQFIGVRGSSYFSDMAIDDVTIEACLTCPPVSNVSVSNITTDGGDIDWTSNGSETSWNIEYGPAGYTPGTGTSINTSNNPETLTGLIDNTEYDVYVQADCGGGDLSTWSGPANFTTDIVCSAPIAVQLLGGTSGTQAELGWNTTGTETDWVIEYGPTGFTPGAGNGTSVNTNTIPTTITGLMPGVVYDFYVQADCGSGQNNPFGGPATYAVPISNDAACDAVQVPVDGSTTTYINDGATLQTGELTALGDNTVWFMFDAPASGHVEIKTCGNDFDNFIEVYELTDCADFTTFSLVDAATDNPFATCSGTIDPAGLNLCDLTAGNTYYLAVGSENAGTTGAFPLTLTEIPNLTAGTGTTSQVCAGDTVTLANALSGADAGGTWSEIDMSGGLLPGGLFSTNNLAYVNYRVEYKVENVCEADSVNVTVAIAGPSQAGQDGTLADCNVLTDFYLYDGLSGNVDFGGTWVDVDATGRLNGSVFSPDSLAAGTYQFDYITTNGVCPADTSTVEVTIQDCLGTEDFTAESFKIFPNPTQGIFYIVSSVNAQDAVVEIMDLQGKVISSQQMNINAGSQYDFDLSQLERGVYLIKVATQENNTVKRVVLQR